MVVRKTRIYVKMYEKQKVTVSLGDFIRLNLNDRGKRSILLIQGLYYTTCHLLSYTPLFKM